MTFKELPTVLNSTKSKDAIVTIEFTPISVMKIRIVVKNWNKWVAGKFEFWYTAASNSGSIVSNNTTVTRIAYVSRFTYSNVKKFKSLTMTKNAGSKAEYPPFYI
jgi:hypothetical protein